MKKIIFILTIIIFLLLAIKVKGKSEELGISNMNCVQTFKSAGVYDESVGIYTVICTADISPEYTCKKLRYDFLNNTKECLEL